jgi:hypothetical protein
MKVNRWERYGADCLRRNSSSFDSPRTFKVPERPPSAVPMDGQRVPAVPDVSEIRVTVHERRGDIA